LGHYRQGPHDIGPGYPTTVARGGVDELGEEHDSGDGAEDTS